MPQPERTFNIYRYPSSGGNISTFRPAGEIIRVSGFAKSTNLGFIVSWKNL